MLKQEDVISIVNQRVPKYLKEEDYQPKKWYSSNLVSKSYCEWTAKAIMQTYNEAKQLPKVEPNENCSYHDGTRKKKKGKLEEIVKSEEKVDEYIADIDRGTQEPRMEERMCHCIFAQDDAGEFKVVDFQIPTANGGHDKIDLLLRKGDVFYMTETKKFTKIAEKFGKQASDETILRCVLEIQTYYQKLNERFFETYEIGGKMKLKKAVLLDENAGAFKQVFDKNGNMVKWVKDIFDFFDITLLKLDRKNGKFFIENV